MVTLLAKEFGKLPSEVVRALDHDPLLHDLAGLELLRYAEAKNAFDRSKNPKDLKPWAGNKKMAHVKRHTLELHRERTARRKAERDARAAEKRGAAKAASAAVRRSIEAR
jgi:hypothetical protein